MGSDSGVTGVSRVEAPTVTKGPQGDGYARVVEAAEKRKADQERERAERERAEREAAAAPDDPTLYVTVPKLGVYNHTVRNTTEPWALDLGAVKIPQTGFPWQDNANTYIAGHRIGYAGTESYNQFYNLPNMQKGDEVIVADANGQEYRYEVSEILAVNPTDTWVTNPVPGRDMVTLQTCVATVNDWWTITPGLLSSPPGPETARLIVRADRVS